jgi:hypothetical protein
MAGSEWACFRFLRPFLSIAEEDFAAVFVQMEEALNFYKG